MPTVAQAAVMKSPKGVDSGHQNRRLAVWPPAHPAHKVSSLESVTDPYRALSPSLAQAQVAPLLPRTLVRSSGAPSTLAALVTGLAHDLEAR